MTDQTQEIVEQATETVAVSAPTPPPPTAGQLLKQARAASGMHIGTLASALKVPVKKIEALESDDWNGESDAVFNRALATSVCRRIKTDPAPILAIMPKGRQQIHEESLLVGLNQSFRLPEESHFSLAPKYVPMLIGALFFLLVAVILIFMPRASKEPAMEKQVIESVMPQLSTQATATPLVVPVVPKSGAVDIAPAKLASAATPIAEPTAKLMPEPISSPTLQMIAKGQVWVEVKDVTQKILIQRTLQPKEKVDVVGAPPLSVIVGRLNEMDSIVVRGKPLTMDGLSKDNVARFEVK